MVAEEAAEILDVPVLKDTSRRKIKQIKHCKASLEELTELPYTVLASMLSVCDLCQMDVTCSAFDKLSRKCGLWRALGEKAFAGIELEKEGAFVGDLLLLKMLKIDWKRRYKYFKLEMPKFRDPFVGAEIAEVKEDDEVAFLNCKLWTNQLHCYSDWGIYLEVEVLSNADNISLSVVDEEASARSGTLFTNITFSPELGTVIKEKILQNSPRSLKCTYYAPLAARSIRFKGRMGLFLCNGHIAFFRRNSWESTEFGVEHHQLRAGGGARLSDWRWTSDPPSLLPRSSLREMWETTGFVSDLGWAKDRKLTPCVSFRNRGSYHVRVVRVGNRPPIWPEKTQGAYLDSNWRTFIWNSERS